MLSKLSLGNLLSVNFIHFKKNRQYFQDGVIKAQSKYRIWNFGVNFHLKLKNTYMQKRLYYPSNDSNGVKTLQTNKKALLDDDWKHHFFSYQFLPIFKTFQ